MVQALEAGKKAYLWMFNMTPWGMDRRLPETFLRDDCWMLAGHEKTGSEPRSHGDGLSGLPPAKKRCDKVMSTQLVWCFMMSRRTVSQRCSPKSSRQNRHHSDSFLGVEKAVLFSSNQLS